MTAPGEEKGMMWSFQNTMILGKSHIQNHKARHALNFWAVLPDLTTSKCLSIWIGKNIGKLILSTVLWKTCGSL